MFWFFNFVFVTLSIAAVYSSSGSLAGAVKAHSLLYPNECAFKWMLIQNPTGLPYLPPSFIKEKGPALEVIDGRASR